MIGGTAKTFFGRVFIRAANKDDIDTFEAPITEANFETAFPTATTEYVDGAGAVEFTEAPEAGYDSAGGDLVQKVSVLPGNLNITGQTKAELKTFIDAHIGEQVDVCIKNDDCGLNGLGDGVILRNVNLWGGRTGTTEGVAMFNLQWQKKFPTKKSYLHHQEFDIVSV